MLAAGATGASADTGTKRHVIAIEPIPSIEANGAKIPLIGLGTWELRGRTCARAVEQALRLGYRHVDTAEMYDNERDVGDGIRASGVKRNELFITTKIWPTHFAPRALERAARECLVRLRLSEVDLLLLHWPNPQIPLVRDARRLVTRSSATASPAISASPISRWRRSRRRWRSQPSRWSAIRSNATPISTSPR